MNQHHDLEKTLREAATAASALLAEIERKKAALDEEAESLKPVVDAWQHYSAKHDHQTPNAGLVAPEANRSRVRRRPKTKGKTVKHIDSVLADGRTYKESEIKNKIKQMFGIDYKRPTIYSVLWRGFQDGKYERQDSKYSLKDWKRSEAITR